MRDGMTPEAADAKDMTISAVAPGVASLGVDAVLAQMPAILFTLDAAGVFQWVGGDGLAQVGSDASALLGQSLFALYGDDTPAAADMRRALSGEVSIGTLAIGHAVFTTAFSPLRASTKRDGAEGPGEIVGVVGVATNVSSHLW